MPEKLIQRAGEATGGGLGGGGIGLLIVWAWNGLNPDYPMSPEVGGAVGGLFGGYLAPIATALQGAILRRLGS